MIRIVIVLVAIWVAAEALANWWVNRRLIKAREMMGEIVRQKSAERVQAAIDDARAAL